MDSRGICVKPTSTRAEVMVCVDRRGIVRWIGRGNVSDLVVERHSADAMVLLVVASLGGMD